MKSKEIIKEIIKFLEEAREKYGVSKDKLDCDGNVTYANGNDGTDFDWAFNDRLCEFGYGIKDGSVWAFKLFIDSSGEARIYCYPNGEMNPVECIKKQITDENGMKRLYRYMMDHADKKDLYDKTLNELGII